MTTKTPQNGTPLGACADLCWSALETTVLFDVEQTPIFAEVIFCAMGAERWTLAIVPMALSGGAIIALLLSKGRVS